jgi:hypothetical protein
MIVYNSYNINETEGKQMATLLKSLNSGSHAATVTSIIDGYGDAAYRVKVLCMSGTHADGDVLFLKNYTKESTANNAAKRELKKWAA